MQRLDETARARDDTIAALLARPKTGSGLCLHRMQAMVRAMLPQAGLAGGRAIHVTGSCGKGTVATLVGAILTASGIRTGVLTSPHMVRFEDRITLDGVPITAADLSRAYRRYEGLEAAYLACHPDESFGAFEAITATALCAFADSDREAIILEAGIGGRYDATRVAGGAIVALTAIDREHVDILGPTEEHILYDKADLCPTGGTLMAGALAPDLMDRLKAYAALRGFEVVDAQEAGRFRIQEATASGTRAEVRLGALTLDGLSTCVHGRAQMGNVMLALLVAQSWLGREGRYEPEAFSAAARLALAETSLPLRFQKVGETPRVFVDGAHTPIAAQALAETAQDLLGDRFVLVFGVSTDKDAGALARPLAALASCIVCVRARHRGGDAKALADRVAALAGSEPGPILWTDNIDDGFALARTEAQRRGQAVLVTGSVFIAREIAALAAGHLVEPFDGL